MYNQKPLSACLAYNFPLRERTSSRTQKNSQIQRAEETGYWDWEKPQEKRDVKNGFKGTGSV